MKPTTSSHPNNRRNIPLTEYHYQSSLEDSRATATNKRETADIAGFWRLGTSHISGGEIRLGYAAETVMFSVMAMLSACQICWMVAAVMRLLRVY